MTQDHIGRLMMVAAIVFATVVIPFNLPFWKWLLIYVPLGVGGFVLMVTAW